MNGHRLVVYTALAALRRRRMVRADSRGVIAVGGAALPEGTSALHAAVLTAARGPRSIEDLVRDSTVTAAAEMIGARRVRRGWVLSARRQTRMRWYGLPGWVVALWCLVAFGLTLPHFSEPGRPLQAPGLLGLGVFLAIGTYTVVDLAPVTRAGSVVLRRERAELSDSASWSPKSDHRSPRRRRRVRGPSGADTKRRCRPAGRTRCTREAAAPNATGRADGITG